MSFFKKLFGGTSLNGDKLAASTEKPDYAQIELLGYFAVGRVLHPSAERSRWSRVLPQPYDETIKGFEKQGWLQVSDDQYKLTVNAAPFVQKYRERQSTEKRDVMPKVRKALQSKDTSEALEIRRAYEARQPLGQAEWSGVEPQLSHSALTRRILFMQHWLMDGLSKETVEWLKLYAAEQHLWGTNWELENGQIPDPVKQELKTAGQEIVATVYWKAYQMALYVENHETWQRCKGGDHVRRIEIKGPGFADVCDACKTLIGKEFLVARTPELPLKSCTCWRGCLLQYDPVLESS